VAALFVLGWTQTIYPCEKLAVSATPAAAVDPRLGKIFGVQAKALEVLTTCPQLHNWFIALKVNF
jgi:hypothetical protein